MNRQEKQKFIDTDKSMVVTRGKGVREGRVKGVKYMVVEENLTLGGKRTMQYTNGKS